MAVTNGAGVEVSAAQIELGASPEDVKAMLGNPKGIMGAGNRQIWNYGPISVIFDAGLVSDVLHSSYKPIASPGRPWAGYTKKARIDPVEASIKIDTPWSEERDGLRIRLKPLNYKWTNGVWVWSGETNWGNNSRTRFLVEFQNVSTQTLTLADPKGLRRLDYKCIHGGGGSSGGYSWSSNYRKLDAEGNMVLQPGAVRTLEVDEYSSDDTCDHHDFRYRYRAPYGMPDVWTNKIQTEWQRVMNPLPENQRPSPWNRMWDMYVSEGMAPVLLDGHWGFINTNAVCVVAPRYRDIKPYQNGVALARESWDGDEFPIDRTGKRLNMEYPFGERTFSEGLALKVEKGLAGFVDTNGTWVIPPTWPLPARGDDDYTIPHAAWSFSNGLASVVCEGKTGFIDRKGNWKVPPQFDYAHVFAEGRALVGRSEGASFIDTNGNVVGGIYTDAHPFSDGRAAVYVGGVYDEWEGWWNSVAGGKWGFIDLSGVMVIQPQFERVDRFEEGVTFAWKDGKLRVIDRAGTFLTGPDVDHAYWTSEGLISIQAREKKGFINVKGQIVVPVIYKDVRGFSEGLAAVKKDDRWGFVDSNGVEKVGLQFQDAQDFHEGLAPVRVGGLWGLIDTNGNIAVTAKFDDIHYRSSEGYWPVEEDGKWGYIDSKGQYLWRPTR